MIGFDRYFTFRDENENIEQLPYVKLTERSTDKYVEYIQGITRFDKLSNSYYGTPTLSFLITLGNPEYLNEFDIPDGAIIRIPFPIDQVRKDYVNFLERKFNE